jgi:hypothetical protein
MKAGILFLVLFWDERRKRYPGASHRMRSSADPMARAHRTRFIHSVQRRNRELRTLVLQSGEASIGGSVFAMFHLDYVSCFLTVLATILLARKSWIGLLIAIVNNLIVCAIALQTSQLGFIPANLLHLHIRVQRAVVAQGTNIHTSRSGAATG